MQAFVSVALSSVLLTVSAQAETNYNVNTKKSIVKWKGKKVTGEHDGTVKLRSGKVKMTKAKKITSGEFTIDLTTIVNRDIKSKKLRTKLENHLKSPDFFNIRQHPTATLKITSSKKIKGNQFELKGPLTIKGITHTVTVPATIQTKGKTATAKAKLKIDRSKWNIKYNSGKFFDPGKLGDKLIYDDIEFEIEIEATPAA